MKTEKRLHEGWKALWLAIAGGLAITLTWNVLMLGLNGFSYLGLLTPFIFKPIGKSEPIPLICPACETEYKIVTIEVRDVQQGRIHCLNCDACFPLARGTLPLSTSL